MTKYNTRYQTRLEKLLSLSNSDSSNTSDYSTDSSSHSESIDDEFYYLKELEDKFKLTDPTLYNNLIKIKDFIYKSEPNILNYIKEPLLDYEKSRLVILFEMYKTTPPMTSEWLEMRDNLNKTFKRYKRDYEQFINFSKEEQKLIEIESQKIESEESDFSYKYKILTLNTSTQNKAVIYRKYLELEDLNTDNEDYAKLKSWIKCAISLPHDNIKPYPFNSNNELTLFLKNVKEQMDIELYGMDNVKEQILLFLNAKILTPGMKKCSLGLVGPPGCGKTVISRLLSRLLNYPFEQISFGGVNDSNFIKGHEYTYIGSGPGAIVKALQRMKYKNGILYLDEYEKISDNKEICSALLHITDPEQHTEFRDSYLQDITIDLSNIWFIYSMNDLPDDSALRDRLFFIELKGYNHKEKIKIICNYILPKALKNIGKNKDDIIISESVASYIIFKINNQDKGVRVLDKVINDLCNKINFLVTHSSNINFFNLSFNINKNNISYSFPFTITKEIVDILIIIREDDTIINTLYN